MKKKITWKDILFLQAIIVIYTTSSVVAKFASAQELLSPTFVFFYGLEVVVLGIYAILWQQIIKKFDLSIAYANRAMAILWSMIWAVLIFKEHITINNIIGVAFVIVGTYILNGENNVKDNSAEDGNAKIKVEETEHAE